MSKNAGYFQLKNRIRLDDYKQLDDGGKGMERLLRYVQEGVEAEGGMISRKAPALFEVALNGAPVKFTTDRETAKEDDKLTLLGIEHPLVRQLMRRHGDLPAAKRALAARSRGEDAVRGVLTIWRVQVHGGKGQYRQSIVTLGLNEAGERSRPIERLATSFRELEPAAEGLVPPEQRVEWVRSVLPEMFQRELAHNGCLADGASFSARLLAWVEVSTLPTLVG